MRIKYPFPLKRKYYNLLVITMLASWTEYNVKNIDNETCFLRKICGRGVKHSTALRQRRQWHRQLPTWYFFYFFGHLSRYLAIDFKDCSMLWQRTCSSSFQEWRDRSFISRQLTYPRLLDEWMTENSNA